MNEIRNKFFPLKDETEMLINMGIEIHKHLGAGFLEIVYKDCLEYELKVANIEYMREQEYKIRYKSIYIPHKFYADFVVFDSIVLEVKAKDAISNEDLAQVINYLKCSGCKVGLILNFGKMRIDIKRVLL